MSRFCFVCLQLVIGPRATRLTPGQRESNMTNCRGLECSVVNSKVIFPHLILALAGSLCRGRKMAVPQYGPELLVMMESTDYRQQQVVGRLANKLY